MACADMKAPAFVSSIAVLAVCGAIAPPAGQQAVRPTTPADVAELWMEPADLERRDLLRGPREGPPAPDPSTLFTFVAVDTSGRSPGYDVRDPNGVLWSVKLEQEAQSEVTASRILWAIGYHQPVTYYLTSWTMTGQDAGPKGGARFRPELDHQKVVGEWEWDENPFVGTRPINGLLVAMMILNNWDLKTSNNKMYEFSNPSSGPRRRYVSRDLGASLGYNKQNKWISWLGIRGMQGSKNDLEGFEKAGFIDGVENGRVDFAYRGPNARHLKTITPADVHWTCDLMSRLSDAQWRDAFRAGGYTPEQSARFIAKLKEKIAQGLALQRTMITDR